MIPYFNHSVEQASVIQKTRETTQKSRKWLIVAKQHAYQEFLKVRALQYGKEMSDGNNI